MNTKERITAAETEILKLHRYYRELRQENQDIKKNLGDHSPFTYEVVVPLPAPVLYNQYVTGVIHTTTGKEFREVPLMKVVEAICKKLGLKIQRIPKAEQSFVAVEEKRSA